jgi:hypothetical protein
MMPLKLFGIAEMKTLTYLFEFYANTDDEVHGEYEDFFGQTIEEAKKQFAQEYPNGRIITHYLLVNEEGEPT